MKRIDLIAGARPNFMKIAPIIDARTSDTSFAASTGLVTFGGASNQKGDVPV